MDVEQIRSLVELMVSNDLSRLEIHEGENHVVLERGHQPIAAAPPAAATPPPPPPAAASAAPAPAASAPAPAGTDLLIRSPMVGTFYAASDPESPPFVNVGDVVSPDTVVCLVEAMKVFNEIKAEVSGRVTRVLVRNGEAVEYDQPLFALAPA